MDLGALWQYWRDGLALQLNGFITSDSFTYHSAAACLFHPDCNLYQPFADTPLPDLMYLYPPAAALFFVPLLIFPAAVTASAATILVVLNVVCCAAVLASFPQARGKLSSSKATCLFTVMLLVFYPGLQTLSNGQINFFIMLLVLLDFSPLKPKRIPHGVLTGIAIGLKLTPAALLLIWLIRKNWQAVAAATSGFVFTLLLGCAKSVYLPWQYYTETIFKVASMSAKNTYRNSMWSLQEILRHYAPDHQLLLVGGCGLLIIPPLLFAGFIATQHKDWLVSIPLTISIALLCTSISFIHHWIWLALLIIWTIRNRKWLPAILLILLTFLFPPLLWNIPKVTEPVLAQVLYFVTGPLLLVTLLVTAGSVIRHYRSSLKTTQQHVEQRSKIRTG